MVKFLLRSKNKFLSSRWDAPYTGAMRCNIRQGQGIHFNDGENFAHDIIYCWLYVNERKNETRCDEKAL